MYSVTNTNPENDVEHIIHFETQEEKEEFVKMEHRFCISAILAVNNSKEKFERKKLKKQLFNRRMDFLVRQGYSKKLGNIWVKEIISQDDPDGDDDFYGT